MWKKLYELTIEKFFSTRHEKEMLVLDIFPGEAAFFTGYKKISQRRKDNVQISYLHRICHPSSLQKIRQINCHLKQKTF